MCKISLLIISHKTKIHVSFLACRLLEDSEFKFKTDIDTSPLLEPEAHRLIQHLARLVVALSH